MGWRERLLPASFRGVPFKVDRARSNFGRKTVTHEFPERDVPYTEDLGRSAKEFQVSGYLVGDDYLEQRDRLLAACEDWGGAGELIHPYFGAVRVNCTRIQTSDDDTETNMLRLSMSFVEAGQELSPGVGINREFELAENKLSALDAAKAKLREIYDITRIPSNKVNEIRNMISSGLSLIEDTRLVVKSAASYRRILDQADDGVEALLNNVTDLGDTFADLFAFGTFPAGLYPSDRDDEYDTDNENNPATEDDSETLFNEFRTLWDFAPSSTTDSSDAVKDFFIETGTIMAAGLVGIIQYTSLDQAEEFRDVVVTQINTLLALDLPVDLAGTLQDLKTSAIEDINERGADLARLTELTLNESAPALVLSFDLYGTVDEEQDIIDRNKVEHPGFVPGGLPIEVLIDV
jgi:prophage DNA circulation protein